MIAGKLTFRGRYTMNKGDIDTLVFMLDEHNVPHKLSLNLNSNAFMLDITFVVFMGRELYKEILIRLANLK